MCALAGRALADPAAATKLADDGAALAKAGKFTDAADKYRAAWNEDRLKPDYLCNAAITTYKAKDLVRAHLLLGQCLEQNSTIEPTQADRVRAALAATEKVLRASGHAPVRITSTPAASISILELGNDEAFVGSRVVWLPFGTYHVRAHAEGYIDQANTVEPKSQEPLTVAIVLEHVKLQVQEPGKPPVEKPFPVTGAPAPAPHARKPSLVPPIVTSVITLAAVGFAVYARSKASDEAMRAQTALDLAVFDADKSSADHWNYAFVAGTGVAVVGAAASVYLWRRAFASDSPLEVQASATSVSVGYHARF